MDHAFKKGSLVLESSFKYLEEFLANSFKVLLIFTVLTLMTYSESSESTMYKRLGAGNCGDQLVQYPFVERISCAILCSSKSECEGFSFNASVNIATGSCDLHSSLHAPDGQMPIDCYGPEAMTTSLLGQAATLASTTTLSPSTTESVAGSWTGTLADVSNTQGSDLSQTNPCGGNNGAVAIYEESSKYYLACKNAPNGYSFQAVNPSQVCSETDQMLCMTQSCGDNSIIRGFMQNNGQDSGPCSDSDPMTKVTSTCHTISGALQEAPSGKSWTNYRICGGSISEFYVITAVAVSANGAAWNLDSITCCLVEQ